MSVFTDKRIFGIKRNNVSGIVTAGQVSANDIILWSVLVLPVNIALYGAGQCIVCIGLFIGNVFTWLFLSKRMNSYTEISNKKIHNAPEFFEARYDSKLIKNITSVIWIITLGAILVSVLKLVIKIVSGYLHINRNICMLIFLGLLILATVFLDNKTIGMAKTIIFIVLILVSVSTIVYTFMVYDTSEILDMYRISDIPASPEKYLDIAYYKGKPIKINDIISMASVGIGCIAMPLMYKGVINIRDIKGIDSSRIWAVIFAGLTILSTSIMSLFIIPFIHPLKLTGRENTFDIFNMLYNSILSENRYSYELKTTAMVVFLLSVIILMESLMRNISEHVRGLILTSDKAFFAHKKLLIDIAAILFVGTIVFLCAAYIKFDSYEIIRMGWGICAGSLAAPCIMSLMWKDATKKGILRGIEVGLIVYFVWRYIPIVNYSMYASTGIMPDAASFLFSLATILIVSMFTKKTDEEERKVFEQMRQSQR